MLHISILHAFLNSRTHRWETRSLQEHLKNVQDQAMYAGRWSCSLRSSDMLFWIIIWNLTLCFHASSVISSVIHGGIDPELRTKSVDYLTSLPFDGYAIGGSLGNGRQELKELLTWMMPLFDMTPSRRAKPRHLLGIADEESTRNAVKFGIDTLDSCFPTRIARHGTLLTRNKDDPQQPGGTLKIRNRENAKAFGVKIDEHCQCSTCQHYDRAYLWHLFKANEPIAMTLAATHNVHYMNDLMAQLRQNIMEDRI